MLHIINAEKRLVMKRPTKIGLYLEELRNKLHYSQEEMAVALTNAGYKCSPQSISHWETGHTNPPLRKGRNVRLFAQVYRTTTTELLERIDYFDPLNDEQLESVTKKIPANLLAFFNEAGPEQIELLSRIAVAILRKD